MRALLILQAMLLLRDSLPYCDSIKVCVGWQVCELLQCLAGAPCLIQMTCIQMQSKDLYTSVLYGALLFLVTFSRLKVAVELCNIQELTNKIR